MLKNERFRQRRGQSWSTVQALLGVFLLMVTATALATETLRLSHAPPRTGLDAFVSYVCDPSGRQGLAAIQDRQFQTLPARGPAFGFRRETCWFHFRLQNTSSEPLELMLLADFGLLNHLALHVPAPAPASGVVGVQVWQSGNAEPFAERPIHTRLNSFPLRLSAGATQDYYLQVRTINAMYVPLVLSGKDTFIEDHIRREWWVGALFGIGIGLLGYNLLLWMSLRERAYLVYVLYVGASLLAFGGLRGANFQLWPNWPGWNYVSQHNFVFLSVFFAAWFAREYLDTRTWPAADRALRWLLGGIALVIALQLILPVYLVARLQGAVALVTVVLVFGIGLLRWRQGMVAARAYLLAWGFLMMATTVASLGGYNLLPWNSSILESTQLALVIQQLLLSWGLADRINALKQVALIRERETQAAQAESEAKSAFLAKMSHEIRTPMNAVLGIAQLLRDDSHDKNQQRYLDTLHVAGKALLTLIDDILDYSKADAGKLVLEETPFNLAALLQECVNIFELSAQQKSLSLVCTTAPDLPHWVTGDPTRLRQILLNLLGNAIKFTDRGMVQLSAELLPGGAPGQSWLRFTVADQGVGIAPEQQGRLFQSFQQVDNSTTRKYGGSGLGLAICRQLVSLMGGDIGVLSTPGQGSTFWFTVCLTPAEPSVMAITTGPDALLVTPALAALRVLVAEDNSINQIVILGMLRKLGIEPQVVGNGAAAVATVQASGDALDIVLMDCEMPELDGYDATRQIREWEARLGRHRLPVIALTAHALPEYRARCLASGMDDYLTKPLSLTELVGKLVHWAPS